MTLSQQRNILFRVESSARVMFYPPVLLICRVSTHQPEHNEEDLNDVSVGHRYEASQQGVAQRYHCRHDDGDLLVQVQDDLQSGACNQYFSISRPDNAVYLNSDCLLPRAPRMEADQKISDIAAGMAWMAPQRPYFCEINQSEQLLSIRS